MSTNKYSLRTQELTLITADAWGESWSRDDLELVVAFTDTVTDEDLAITLGRSLYAVWSVQHRLRANGFDVAPLVTRRAPRPSERTYTFIDGDVPADW